MPKYAEEGVFYAHGIKYDARFHKRPVDAVVPAHTGAKFLQSPHKPDAKAGARDMLRDHLLGWFKYVPMVRAAFLAYNLQILGIRLRLR